MAKKYHSCTESRNAHSSSFFDCFYVLPAPTLIAILQGETNPQVNKNIPQDSMCLVFMITWLACKLSELYSKLKFSIMFWGNTRWFTVGQIQTLPATLYMNNLLWFLEGLAMLSSSPVYRTDRCESPPGVFFSLYDMILWPWNKMSRTELSSANRVIIMNITLNSQFLCHTYLIEKLILITLNCIGQETYPVYTSEK